MGDAMDISYNNLPSYKDGWNDGVHWLGELRDWAARYENAHMVPAKTNRQCGDSFFRSILPGFAPHHQDTFKEVASVLLGKRLRTAMM